MDRSPAFPTGNCSSGSTRGEAQAGNRRLLRSSPGTGRWSCASAGRLWGTATTPTTRSRPSSSCSPAKLSHCAILISSAPGSTAWRSARRGRPMPGSLDCAEWRRATRWLAQPWIPTFWSIRGSAPQRIQRSPASTPSRCTTRSTVSQNHSGCPSCSATSKISPSTRRPVACNGRPEPSAAGWPEPVKSCAAGSTAAAWCCQPPRWRRLSVQDQPEHPCLRRCAMQPQKPRFASPPGRPSRPRWQSSRTTF